MKKDIYIYGAGNRGKELIDSLQKFYSHQIKVIGFIESYVKGEKYGFPIYSTKSIPKNSTIVVSIFQFDVVLPLVLELKKQGYANVYWYNHENIRHKRIDFFTEQCITCEDWNLDTLLHVEMHAFDACNLNCVGCTHFSPIFKKEKPDTQGQIKNIELLHEKIKSVVRFYILGGEPFLNNEIRVYIQRIKQLYPNASVTIVTNGLLIPKLPDALLQYLGKENICVSISGYEPTLRVLENIEHIMCRHNIMYNVRNFKTEFNIPLSFKPVEIPHCISEGCVTIAKGMISCCPTLMYIDDLNKKFNLNFPIDGRINLDSNLTGKEIKARLMQRVPLCSYCNKNEISWRTCGGEVVAENFVRFED